MLQLTIYCHLRPPKSMLLSTETGWGIRTPVTYLQSFHLQFRFAPPPNTVRNIASERCWRKFAFPGWHTVHACGANLALLPFCNLPFPPLAPLLRLPSSLSKSDRRVQLGRLGSAVSLPSGSGGGTSAEKSISVYFDISKFV